MNEDTIKLHDGTVLERRGDNLMGVNGIPLNMWQVVDLLAAEVAAHQQTRERAEQAEAAHARAVEQLTEEESRRYQLEAKVAVLVEALEAWRHEDAEWSVPGEAVSAILASLPDRARALLDALCEVKRNLDRPNTPDFEKLDRIRIACEALARCEGSKT